VFPPTRKREKKGRDRREEKREKKSLPKEPIIENCPLRKNGKA
jgi:hypothetical protein